MKTSPKNYALNIQIKIQLISSLTFTYITTLISDMLLFTVHFHFTNFIFYIATLLIPSQNLTVLHFRLTYLYNICSDMSL